ncbi:hypothetical protein EVA_11129 [gut metagenome]|uniref:Uncharacterized protein n=1 Tax=gut metagenome TaxID=749906 RepID=J9CL14_9ZZZZ
MPQRRTVTGSTSLTPQVTLTSLLRLNAVCVCLMVPLPFCVLRVALSLSLRPFGVRLISTRFPVWPILTRWTSWVPISTVL